MAESQDTPRVQNPTRVEITKLSDQDLISTFQTALSEAVGGIKTILEGVQKNTSGIPDAVKFYTEQKGLSGNESRPLVEGAPQPIGVGAPTSASTSGGLVGAGPPPQPTSPSEQGGPSGSPTLMSRWKGGLQSVDQGLLNVPVLGSVYSHAQNALHGALTPIGQSGSLWTGQGVPVDAQGQQVDPTTGEPATGPFAASLKYAAQYAAPAAIWSSAVPAFHAAQQFFNPSSLSQWGTQLGTPPSQDATNVLGLRIPFGSMGTGASDVASSVWQGITTPGLSTGQVMQTKQSLADLGWTPDNPMWGQLSDSVNSLKDLGGDRLGANPGITEMLDQSTRYGTSSIESMISTMKKIPDSAKAAQVSWEQMITDMNNMGQLYQTQGGTTSAGNKFAQQWSQDTGFPASVAETAIQNPFIQSYATSQTGLMPQMQGLMSPGQRIGSIFGAVNQVYSAMSGFQTQKTPIPGPGGFETSISGRDQALAMTSQMTGLSPQVLKQMTDPKLAKGIESAGTLRDAYRAWVSRTHTAGKEAWSLKPTGQGKDLGDFVKQMGDARSVQTGKKIFSQGDLDKIRGLSVDSPSVREAARQRVLDSGNLPSEGGLSAQDRQDLRDSGVARTMMGQQALHGTSPTSPPKDILHSSQGKDALDWALQKQRKEAIQNLAHEGIQQGAKARQIMEGKSGQSPAGGHSIQIELTRQAKKVVQFKGKPGQTKVEASAGSDSTNNGFLGSSSISPISPAPNDPTNPLSMVNTPIPVIGTPINAAVDSPAAPWNW